MMMPMISKDIEEGGSSSGNEAVIGLGIRSLRAQCISNWNSEHMRDFSHKSGELRDLHWDPQLLEK